MAPTLPLCGEGLANMGSAGAARRRPVTVPPHGQGAQSQDRSEAGLVSAGTRVEIVLRLLEPEDRAPGLPPDTARLPYEARVRGTLCDDARAGDEATVRTAAGRLLTGRLETVGPGDWHSFGRPVPALVSAIEAITELRASLE